MTTCICKASFCFWGWGDGLWMSRMEEKGTGGKGKTKS